MSIIIQTNSGTTGSSGTVSFNQNVQAGSSILVGVVCNENLFTSATITDSQGNTYALIEMSTRLSAGGGFFWTAIYAAVNAVGGADTITTTFSGITLGALNTTVIAEVNGTLAGVDATGTAGVVGNGGDSFPSTSLPVTNANELVFTFLSVPACDNGSAPSGYSSFFAPSPTSVYAIAWTQTPTPGTDTIQWGGTVTGGNFNIPISAVAATFLVGAPPPPPPAQAVVGNQTGNPIQFFGVSPTNPATVRTQSNSQQVFTFDSTSRPGIPSAFRYANDANFLGRTAMPGQLLVLPGNGWFRGTQYFVCASGTITIPLSAQNAGVSFTLYSNKFVNLASSGLNIQITSDALASLPNTSLGANLNSYTWSLVAPISGGFGPTTSTLNCVGTWNLNGNTSSSSGSSSISNGTTGPKAQLSLGVTFSGTVSGNDQFQATLTQFEIQEL